MLFCFNGTATTEIYTLSLHDALPIFAALSEMGCTEVMVVVGGRSVGDILELLHDGSDLGLSLTYRYQRGALGIAHADRKSTRLNSSHANISYAVFCLKKIVLIEAERQ